MEKLTAARVGGANNSSSNCLRIANALPQNDAFPFSGLLSDSSGTICNDENFQETTRKFGFYIIVCLFINSDTREVRQIDIQLDFLYPLR